MYQKPLSKKQKALLHIAKSKIGMTDAEYRDLLERFGVKSSKDLKQDQWDELYAHLQHCGFVPHHKKAKKSGMHERPARDKASLTSKVEALLADMDLSWAYADELARRICKVDKFRFVARDEIYKIITALRKKQVAMGRVYQEGVWI